MCAVGLVIAVAYDGDVSCNYMYMYIYVLKIGVITFVIVVNIMNRCVYGRQSVFYCSTSFT